MSSVKQKIKYKLLTFDELVINIDRMSRFKLPEDSFPRVFYSVLYKCLITPKYTKNEIEKLPDDLVSLYVKEIWNESVSKNFDFIENDFAINNIFKQMIYSVFANIDKRTKTFINTKLLLSPILKNIDYNIAPLNLKLLIQANKKYHSQNKICPDKQNLKNENHISAQGANREFCDKGSDKLIDLDKLRFKYKLKFPIKKLLIVEGITEEILLPVFADKIGFNFDEIGIFILGAGGKSKSPDIYLQMKDKLKIPVILLFDSDAFEICQSLTKVLLKKDKMIIIEKGEFEDILSVNLIKRTLNSEYDIPIPLSVKDFSIYSRMCKNIEEVYRTRKIGEFKKSKFSKIISKNIKYKTDITDDIKSIITEIV